MSALQTARLASVRTPTETPALQLGDILTIQQVADLLQFSKRQVYELVSAMVTRGHEVSVLIRDRRFWSRARSQ